MAWSFNETKKMLRQPPSSRLYGLISVVNLITMSIADWRWRNGYVGRFSIDFTGEWGGYEGI